MCRLESSFYSTHISVPIVHIKVIPLGTSSHSSLVELMDVNSICVSLFNLPKKISVGLFHTKSKATWNHWTCQLIDSGISRFHIPFMWTCFPGLYIPYIIYIYNGLVFKNSKFPVLFYILIFLQKWKFIYFCGKKHIFEYLLFTIKISVGTCFFVQNLWFEINCILKNYKPQNPKTLTFIISCRGVEG